MANPSTTYTLINGTANDAGPVNTNFSDIIAALTDGTKDLTVYDVACNSVSFTSISSTNANKVIDSYTRTTGTSVAARGVAISDSSGNFNTTSTSNVDITNNSVTITTSGRPVFVGIVPDGSTQSQIAVTDGTDGTSINPGMYLTLVRDATNIAVCRQNSFVALPFGGPDVLNLVSLGVFPSIFVIDAVAAGTYTYKSRVRADSGTTAYVVGCKLIVYEL
jgi:hypothetical protein